MDGHRASEEEIVRGLTAVAHCAGSYAEASRLLAADGLKINQTTLADWCTRRFPDRYADLREKYAAQIEQKLIHDMRDLAAQGVEAQRLAIEKAHSRLKAGKDEDPSKTAANLSRVVQTNVDKMLAVSGRPTSIRQDRSLDEILRALVAQKIIELPPEAVTEAPELEAAS